MLARKNIVAIGLIVLAGCSAPGGGDPTSGDSTDAAAPPTETTADAANAGSADARSTKPSDDAGSSVDATTGQGDATDERSIADARDVSEASADGAAGNLHDAEALDAGNADGGPDPETGRLVGITAAHNAVRASVQTEPPLPPLVWSQTIADYAQQWATSLATSMCAQPQHRSAAELSAKNYGENLATFESGGLRSGVASTAQQAVSAWAAESTCWTYGTIRGTEKCDTACYTNLHSDGCGHYTQVVWRASTQLGCGVASCKNGSLTEDIWICNYAPAGNFVGRAPY
jgi:pathogenesis-related protein 1